MSFSERPHDSTSLLRPQPSKNSMEESQIRSISHRQNGATGNESLIESRIHIDHSQIESTDLSKQFNATALDELRQLGVQTFQASTFDQNVARQLDEQMEQHNAYRNHRELNFLRNQKEQAQTQLQRLRIQCNRLAKQPPSDVESKELYDVCVTAYQKLQQDLEDLNSKINSLVEEIDAQLKNDRESRKKQESINGMPIDFDLGMHMTTRKEQELAIQSIHQSSSQSLSGLDSQISLEPTKLFDEIEADEEASREKSKKRKQRSEAAIQGQQKSHKTSSKYFPQSKSTRLSNTDEEEYEKIELTYPQRLQNQSDSSSSEENYLQPDEEDGLVEDEEVDGTVPTVSKQKVQRTKSGDFHDQSEDDFAKRVDDWIVEHPDDPRSKAIAKLRKLNKSTQVEQIPKIHSFASVNRNKSIGSVRFNGGFEMPKYLYRKLFEHQRVAVRWMWELHTSQAGGILGDEMGLGKTLEVIAFLAGLNYSGMVDGPILIACPTTVVSHWVREFHWWAPEFRILRFKGSTANQIRPILNICRRSLRQQNPFAMRYSYLKEEVERLRQKLQKKTKSHSKSQPRAKPWSSRMDVDDNESLDLEVVDDFGQEKGQYGISDDHSSEEELEESLAGDSSHAQNIKSNALEVEDAKRIQEDDMDLIQNVDSKTPIVFIISYESLRMNIEDIIKINWNYAILDEGHKIRNPDAGLTIAAKQIPTPYRLILSGTPIQNSLVELWSLFDFCYPGKLGTQEAFETHFAWPIQRGGYATSTQMEVRVAYKCAVALRDLVNPYLLRRSKDQVNIQLPDKSEQILLCQLTNEQREAYRKFLASTDARAVYEGLKNMLFGVDILRKICNHTWLLRSDHGKGELEHASLEAMTSASAKLKVLNHILATWKEQGHRVLVFAQTIQMLDILETFVKKLGYVYLRMDGSTASVRRQGLVDEFNESSNIMDEEDRAFVFLLTTRVGGLGINLTSANRVVVFDPDWNPMTDLQAKERAYRIGQSKNVIVYRLVTSGTIEEKIYHRQVFKQFLTQKVLKDPRQTRAFFKKSDLRDLFKLEDRSYTRDDNDLLTQVPTQVSASDAAQSEQNDTTSASNDWLLGELMDQNGIAGALDHQAVVDSNTNGRRVSTAAGYIENEADNLAKRAVALLRSSKASSMALESSATTRSSGPKFGTVSSTLNVHAPQGQAKVSGLGVTTSSSTVGRDVLSSMKTHSEQPLVESQGHLFQLKNFFLKLGGIASSDQIANYFKVKIPATQLHVFRSLLREIADFDPKSRQWTLRAWAGGTQEP